MTKTNEKSCLQTCLLQTPSISIDFKVHFSSFCSDQHILLELERDNLLSFTPSRQVSGRRLVCHDDRYILNLASETGAIVVSNDNYRDLVNEKPDYKKVIEEKILMYTFVNDR
jgi:ribonuclease ZC3H12